MMLLSPLGCENRESKISSLLYSSEGYIASKDYKQVHVVYTKLEKLDDSKASTVKLNKMVEDTLSKTIDEYVNAKKYDEILNELEKASADYPQLDADTISKYKAKVLELKKSNDSYLSALNLLESGKFEEAITKFNEVSKEDAANYPSVQDKINEARDGIFNNFVGQAVDSFNNKDYSGALEKIDKALSIKADNNAQDLKNKYLSAQEEQKKKQAETEAKAKAKAASDAKAKAEALEAQRKAEEQAKENTPFESKNEPEKYINSLNMSSSTQYLLYVNLAQQKTYIFQGYKNHWTLLKDWLCSTGVGPPNDKDTGTLTGQFTIKQRGTWFFNEKYKEGAEYWTQFYGNWLFHSLPMDKNHKVTDTTLGKPASHGCVRLAIENAKWIYNNIPSGTKVYIQ